MSSEMTPPNSGQLPNAYYRICLRITLGASRLQKILADRYAALAYGSQNLADALQFIVRRSLAFNAQTNVEINSALKENRAFRSFYALPAMQDDARQPTNHYDSHPSLRDRIAYLERVNKVADEVDDGASVETVLPNLTTFADEMNQRTKRNVDAQLRQMRHLQQLQRQRSH
jgi:hypothetical protein